MSFIPPLFAKFGKTAADLLNQKFDANKEDFKHQFSVKSQSNAVTVTSTVVSESAGVNQLTGKVNAKYEDKAFGDVSIEYVTDQKIKIASKLIKLYKGLILNTEANHVGGKYFGKAGSEYTRENYSGSVEYNSKANSVLASSAFGIDGFSVGGAVTAKIADQGSYNVDFGAQYEDGNLIATAVVENGSAIGASIFHRVNSDLQLASKFVTSYSGDSSLALGGQYKVNPATVAKSKVIVFSDKTYVVAGHVSHKLANPNATISLTNQWSPAKPAASQFGVNVAFGDN